MVRRKVMQNKQMGRKGYLYTLVVFKQTSEVNKGAGHAGVSEGQRRWRE